MDFDLHVKTPGNKDHLYYGNKEGRGPDKGKLDIDMREGAQKRNVENIYFDAPVSGTYTALVRHYSNQGRPAQNVPYTIKISAAGTTLYERTFRDLPRVKTRSRLIFLTWPSRKVEEAGVGGATSSDDKSADTWHTR